MDFSYSDKVDDLRMRVQQFMDEYIVPRCAQCGR